MILTNFKIFGNFLICFRKFDWKSKRRHSVLEFGAKSGKNFIKNSQKKCKIRSVCDWISEYSLIQSRKSFGHSRKAIFDERIEIKERCKGVHCVDLGESFPTHIYLQKLASIQPRTSPLNFAGAPLQSEDPCLKRSTKFCMLLRRHRCIACITTSSEYLKPADM